MHEGISSLHLSWWLCAFVNIHTQSHVYSQTCIHIYSYTHTYILDTCILTNSYTHTHTHTTHTHVHTHTHTRSHVYSQTHAHTQYLFLPLSWFACFHLSSLWFRFPCLLLTPALSWLGRGVKPKDDGVVTSEGQSQTLSVTPCMATTTVYCNLPQCTVIYHSVLL